jgi:hypothetical protein
MTSDQSTLAALATAERQMLLAGLSETLGFKLLDVRRIAPPGQRGAPRIVIPRLVKYEIETPRGVVTIPLRKFVSQTGFGNALFGLLDYAPRRLSSDEWRAVLGKLGRAMRLCESAGHGNEECP